MTARFHFVLATILFSYDPVLAQEAVRAPVTEEIEVSLISLYAAVRDSKDRPVKGLKQDDFVLTDGGQPVPITQFSGDPSEPASVAFLVDTSGSMRVSGKYDIAEQLIDAVLERLQSDDEASLIAFGDERVRTVVDFTRDKSHISNQLAGQRLTGPTALWDAIVFSQKLVVQSYGKKAMILVSDGFDNRSESVFKRAVDEASRIKLPVYVCEIAISDEDELREVHFDSPLKNFAEATGALHFALESEGEKGIRDVAERLVEEIRYQYYIGISGGAIGAASRLQLTTRNPDLHVRLRHAL